MGTDNISENDLTQSEKIGKIESEVHTLTSNNATLFLKLDKLSDELKDFAKNMAPKPMSTAALLGGGAAFVGIIGGMLATVIYISNSTNAPLQMQMQQITSNTQLQMQQLTTAVTAVNNSVMNNNNNIQLTNKSITSIKKSTSDNADSLKYILYEKELFSQITAIQKDIEYLKNKQRRP